MKSGKSESLQSQYGWRFEQLLNELESPTSYLHELIIISHESGLLHPAVWPRTEGTLEFLTDIWFENPLVPDLINLRHESWPDPSQVIELGQIEEIFRV